MADNKKSNGARRLPQLGDSRADRGRSAGPGKAGVVDSYLHGCSLEEAAEEAAQRWCVMSHSYATAVTALLHQG